MAKNPFVFGAVVSGQNFTGRKDELRELVVDLEGGTNIIMFSPRKYGKTSLMFKIIEHLRSKGILCVYVDLYAVTDKLTFANILTTAIAKAKADKLEEMLQIIRDHIPPIKLTIKPSGDLGTDSGIELEISRGKDDVDATLQQLYDLPEKIAKKKKKKLVMIFDEFQEISKLNGGNIEAEIRTKIQHHKNASYVFMGSQRHLLVQMFADARRPLYNIGKMFGLNAINKVDFAEFIQKRFKSCGIRVSDQVVSDILDLTQCHPYYTQQLCHQLWIICISKKLHVVAPAHVAEAKEQLIKNHDYAYSVLWDTANPRQRSALIAMAVSHNDKIFSSDFRDVHNLGPPSTMARVIRSLEDKSLVEKTGKRYVISDIFFREWLRRLR